MKRSLLILLLLAPLSIYGQLEITEEALPIDEDFEWFLGNGFTPGGSLEGTIDSDIFWTKSRDGAIVDFGDYVTTGEFARGISEGGASLEGGIYAFNTGNNIAFGIKPTEKYYSPGYVNVKIQNKMPNSIIHSLQISYDIYYNNTTDVKTELKLYYSTNNQDFYKVDSSSFLTPDISDPGWQKISRSFALSSAQHLVNIKSDEFYFLKWRIQAGNGCVTGDEIAIDNFKITANPTVIFTEILQEPTSIDANGDEILSEAQDEFVEFILNKRKEVLDLSGWKIKINGITRHIFPYGSGLIPDQGAVIFGGGTPKGDFGGVLLQTASTGSLDIPNTGFEISLVDDEDNQKASAYIRSSLTNDAWHRKYYDGGPFIAHSSYDKDNPITHSPGKTIRGGNDIYLDDAIVWSNKTNSWVEYSDGDPATDAVNVIINGTYNLSEGNITCDNITVNGTLIIPSGKFIKMSEITGNLINPGSFNVESGGIFLSPLVILGDVVIKRNTPWGDTDGRYSFIGSPVKDFIIGDLGGGFYFRFDEPTNSYVSVESGSTMNTAVGYTIANKKELVFTGKPHSGTQTISISKNTGPDEDYNLIANPYSAPVSYTSFMTENGPDGSQVITGTIYIWDDGGSNTGSGTTSDFRIVTAAGDAGGTTYTGSTYNGNLGTAQGFFAVGDRDTPENEISFTNDMRQSSGNEDEHFFRKAESEISRFKLSISDGDTYYESLLAFVEDATEGYDKKYDGPMFSVSEKAKIYSYIEDKKYSIQALPPVIEKVEIELGIDIINDGKFEINLHSLENVDLLNFYLYDHKTDQYINLRENNYTFEFDATQGENQNRFVLIASTSRILAFEKSLENQFRTFYKNGTLSVFLDEYNGTANVSIFDISGKAVNRFNGLFSRGLMVKRLNYSGNKLYLLNIEIAEEQYTTKFISH